MSVHRGISGGTGQILSVSVRDMLSCFRVSEPLGQSEINDVNEMLFLTDTDQKIVWLDISVQKMP